MGLLIAVIVVVGGFYLLLGLFQRAVLVKGCPHCQRLIAKTARKCEYCHEWQPSSSPPVGSGRSS